MEPDRDSGTDRHTQMGLDRDRGTDTHRDRQTDRHKDRDRKRERVFAVFARAFGETSSLSLSPISFPTACASFARAARKPGFEMLLVFIAERLDID